MRGDREGDGIRWQEFHNALTTAQGAIDTIGPDGDWVPSLREFAKDHLAIPGKENTSDLKVAIVCKQKYPEHPELLDKFSNEQLRNALKSRPLFAPRWSGQLLSHADAKGTRGLNEWTPTVMMSPCPIDASTRTVKSMLPGNYISLWRQETS